MPKLYILSGCNGSGKTTASYMLLPELFGCSEFVNSDEFAKSLSPFDPAAASLAAGRLMVKKTQYLLKRNKDFCIETTLATRSLLNTIQTAKEKEYEVTILYFWLNSVELALKRIRDRVAAGGHNIPEHIVRRRYDMGIQYFFNDYMGVCDRWVLADNSKTPFTVIAEGSSKHCDVKDPEKFSLIWKKVYPEEDGYIEEI